MYISLEKLFSDHRNYNNYINGLGLNHINFSNRVEKFIVLSKMLANDGFLSDYETKMVNSDKYTSYVSVAKKYGDILELYSLDN